ncbi:MAG: winged helix-turn-helix domain-containing protein [Flavobacteriales bacterium]
MNYSIKSRIWIEANNRVFLGEGRIRLLKAIEKTGSLSKAAKQEKISYNKAWQLIDSVNKTAKKPLIQKNIGGKGGGGTTLTEYGKKMITKFEEINHNCWNFLDEQIKNLNSF